METYIASQRQLFPTTTGVYSICFINSIKRKFYIGSAGIKDPNYSSEEGFRNRWKRHLSDLKKGKHHSIKLQRAYDKYGEKEMTFSVVEECPPEKCKELENIYLKKFNSCKNGYNIASDSIRSRYGIKNTKESLDKQRATRRLAREPYEKRVLEVFEETKSTLKTEKILGISHKTIRTILKDYGIRPRMGWSLKKNVFAYDLKGEFKGQWEDSLSCSKALGIRTPSLISKVILGQVCQIQGFFFSRSFMEKDDVLNKIKETKENLNFKRK